MGKKHLIVAAMLLTLAPNAFAQSVTDKAKAKIAEEKEKARVEEAKGLLKEQSEIQARLKKIEERLKQLDSGAEPEKKARGDDITYSNAITCCVMSYR